MSSLLFGLTLSAAVGLQLTAGFDPFVDGPHPIVHKTIHAIGNPGLDNMLEVYAPHPASELVSPMMWVVTGMGGVIPGVFYYQIFERIASHGITVVSAASAGPGAETYEGVWLDGAMEWAEAHLADKLAAEGVGEELILDHRTKYLFGHSSGGHVVAAYLKHHCGDIKGQILFSPVDGFDPFGWIDNFVITPGEYLNYALPTLVLMAGLDGLSGLDNLGNLIPPCAPEDLSNLRFYDAMAGPTWLVNATAFGHADCLDETYAAGVGFTHFCSSADKTVDRDDYRAHVAGEIVSFLTLLAGGEECSTEKYLQDPSQLPVAATVMHKDSILDGDSNVCGQAFCVWQEAPFSKK